MGDTKQTPSTVIQTCADNGKRQPAHLSARAIAGSGKRTFAQYRKAFPKLSNALMTGFVVAPWSLPQRWRRAAEHFDIAVLLGPPFDLAPYTIVQLLDLEEVFPECRLTIDQPPWLLRDGLLTLSLWVGIDRVFTLSFILGFERGNLVAFVGGLQGRGDENSINLYRLMTKTSHGIRPRDLIIEIFRLVCARAGISHIYGISNATQYYRTTYFRFIKRIEPLRLDFNKVWTERGGFLAANGLFTLAPGLHLRDADQIPAKKRAMYRLRGDLMLEISRKITTALADAKTH